MTQTMTKMAERIDALATVIAESMKGPAPNESKTDKALGYKMNGIHRLLAHELASKVEDEDYRRIAEEHMTMVLGVVLNRFDSVDDIVLTLLNLDTGEELTHDHFKGEVVEDLEDEADRRTDELIRQAEASGKPLNTAWILSRPRVHDPLEAALAAFLKRKTEQTQVSMTAHDLLMKLAKMKEAQG